MEVKGKIQTSEIQVLKDIFSQTFDSILRNYNSLLFAIKDNAGMEAIKMAEEQLMERKIDISAFPNRDKMHYYITHYVRDIPVIARLQQYINRTEYPKNHINKEQIKENILEARLGLNGKLFLVHEAESGMEEILKQWATLQFVIENPDCVSIATIEQLMECGYQGTCGTPIMKEMFYLIQQLHQLKIENEKLQKESALAQQDKTKKLD